MQEFGQIGEKYIWIYSERELRMGGPYVGPLEVHEFHKDVDPETLRKERLDLPSGQKPNPKYQPLFQSPPFTFHIFRFTDLN